ncbi:MAG: peptidase family m28 [Bacteriovoracaceae bacterium]|nr:peptidase family m28 [Bacteriovoracaceae bacterium]
MRKVFEIFSLLVFLKLTNCFICSSVYANQADCIEAIKHLEIITGVRTFAYLGEEQKIVDRSVNQRGFNGRGVTVHYLESVAQQLGYKTDRQSWNARMRSSGGSIELTNLIVNGPAASTSAPTLIIGAHYDSINSDSGSWMDRHGRYRATPGADDNGSGVVALLTLLKRFRSIAPKLNLQIVFFDAEEPSPTGVFVGSRYFVNHLVKNGKVTSVKMAIILDMIGRPSRLYPDLYNLSADKISPSFLIEGLSAKQAPFPFIRESEQKDFINITDNQNFNKAGIPSILVTDVVSLRDLPDHYHTVRDRAEFIDWRYWESIVNQVENLVRKIAR